MSTRERALKRFERWGPLAFIVGGIGLLGTTVVGSMDVAGVIDTSPRLAMGPLLFGLWFVFVGLIGLSPRIADDAPRLRRGGLGTSAIAWLVWTITLLAAIGIDLTTARTFAEPGSWAPPLLAVAFVLALVSFLAYGIASVRTGTPSGTLGLFLLVPVGAFLGQAILLASKILTGDVVAVLQLAFGGITALVLILVGYRLSDGTREAASTDTPTQSST